MNYEKKLNFLFIRTLWSFELQKLKCDFIKITCGYHPMTYHLHSHIS